MGWLDDVKDSIIDAVSAVGDIFSDPLSAIGDILEGTLNMMTLGTYQFAKDQIGGLFDYDIPYQDRTQMVRAAAGSRQLVYGRTRVGGNLVYIESYYSDRRFIMMTLVVAAHQVDKITGVYANGNLVASARPSGNGRMPAVIDGKYNRSGDESRIVCWSVDGTQAGAVIPTVTPGGNPVNPPHWTVRHKLLGMAYVHIFCWYHQEIFDSGLPSFEIELRGKNDIYDPRTGTIGYTDNQALCVLDALRWDRMFNAPDSDIDMDSFVNAADIADQLVSSGPNGQTEKRYTVNGSIPIDRTPLEVLLSLSKAGAGIPVYSQGQWTYVPGAYSDPVMDLNESHFIGGMNMQPGPPKRSRHNKAVGTYIDASQRFEEVEFPPLLIQAYVDDDLEVLEKNYQFAMTSSGSMARRLAKIDIERNRYGITVQFTAKFNTLVLTPGDRVTLSLEKFGWDKRIFRVEDMNFSFEKGVALTLREDSPDIYNWTEGDVLEIDSPPVIQIPDGLGVSAPTGLVVGEELYETITRAAVKVRMLVSWDGDDDGVAEAYDIQYRKVADKEWTDAATFWQDNDIVIDDVDDDPYQVRVRAINRSGLRSDWTVVEYTVLGKTAPPPDVPLLFIEQDILKWTYPDAPLDLAGFYLRFQNGDRRFWADATPMHEGIVTETLFDVAEYNGTKTFLVKAVDTTGNVSNNAAVLVQGLGDVPVQNVIKAQHEAPDWSSTVEDYNFMVRTGDNNVEQFQVRTGGGVVEDFIVRSAASFQGGFVNPDGYLEGEEIGSFYGESSAIFYAPDDATLFYSSEYKRLEYQWSFTVPADDEGATLSVEVDAQNAFNQRVDYIPPGYTGDRLAFPGAIKAEAGTYQFFFAIPQQYLPGPPIVEDIITRLDVGDIEERLGDVVLDAAGTRLPIVRNYREIVVVNLTLQETSSGATSIKILDKDPINGPLVRAFDDSGTGVSATIDALIQGY